MFGLHADISRTAFYRQSVVVGVYREKSPNGTYCVFPIWGFEGYAANAALSR